MSGMVISAVAEHLPDRIERLVYLAAYLPQNGQGLFDVIHANRQAGSPAPIEQAMQLSQDKRTCRIADEDISRLFYSRCPEASRSLIPASLPPQAALPLSGKVRLSRDNFGRVPRTYICCLHDQIIPISHQRHMLMRQACDEMIQLDADHSPFVSSPETLAAILDSVCQGS